MAERIQTAAVLGAGVMGTGIAAHLAGAGIRTHLLDIVLPNQPKNKLADEAVAKALKSKPATFFDPDCTRLITTGNFDDDLGRLAGCDLVIEAVTENVEIKKKLFDKVAKVIGPNTLLASNTSGLSIVAMTEGLPEDLQKRFLVMHFFNPVRYMHLLEIVPGPKTDPKRVEQATRIGQLLGKGVVYGKDTPNFIANRIGTYGLMKTIQLMQQEGLSVEEVDKIVGEPMGRPKTAAFRTADLVGIDTFLHVVQNCYDSLSKDEEREVFKIPGFIQTLKEKGNLGQKSGAGFYKKNGDDIWVLDLGTGEYRAQNKVRYESIGAVRNIEDPKERLKSFINQNDKAANFAWKALAHTLSYAARRVGEIADDLVQIDRALRWGFNWSMGPFEAWDAIGVEESVARMKKDGVTVPAWIDDMLKSGRKSFYEGPLNERSAWAPKPKKAELIKRDPRNLELAVLKADKKRIVESNLGATLVDLGDGALCLEVHTKMNTIDDDVTKMLVRGVEVAEKDFEALVIGNDGEHFGAGANLMLIYMGAQQQAWDQIGSAIGQLQGALQGLRYARVPVVAAPFQYTFGGCAEIAMAADACQAHAETYIGLVEVGAGLIPAGGGCLRMVERWTEDAQSVEGVDLFNFIAGGSLNIAMAKVATGAEEGKRLRYLSRHDGISLNRDQLLYEAKMRALGMARAGYQAPRPRVIKAAGYDAGKTISMRVWAMVEGGFASPHDALIGKKVVHVLCGGNVAPGTELSEQHYLDLEREAFLSLLGEEKTQARIQSLLMNNKPLRN